MVPQSVAQRAEVSLRSRYTSHDDVRFQRISESTYRFQTCTIPPIYLSFRPAPWDGDEAYAVDLELPVISGFAITSEFLGWMAQSQSIDGARSFRFKLTVLEDPRAGSVGNLAFTHSSHSEDLDSPTLSLALTQMSYFGAQVRAGGTQLFGGYVPD